jgi:hypothetical protein
MNVRLVLLPALALAAAIVIWKSGDTAANPTPAATWRVGLGTEIRQGRNYDELAPESPVRLSFACSEPRHVYVFSHSVEDGTLLLFPSAALKGGLANPLPAGNSVLPGTADDKELAWTTRSGIRGVTTFVAIASRGPVDELEALLGNVRFWSNSIFTDGRMEVTKAKEGVDVLGPPRSAAFPSPLLQRAAERAITESLPNGPMQPDGALPGVWLTSWKVVEKKKV